MALGVNIVSSFDSKGINKAISDFKKLDGAGNKATFGLRTMDKAFTNGAKNIAKYGGLLAAGLGLAALHMVKGAELANQADQRLRQVAISMGLFGEQSAAVTDRLIALADAQEYELGVTAETIKLTQAKLLTFKELAVTAGEVGGAFDRATIAAIDLGAAGFGEASQNATQLGKALNDPVKGITALARSGVTFTAQEKEKIKVLVESGKMLEAQDTLLKAIETQVGGTAAATVTDTFKIAMAFGHIRDVIGNLLLPIFEKFADFMVNTVVPYATKVEEKFGNEGIGGGLKFLSQGFLNVTTDMGKFGNTLLVLTAAFVALRLVTIAATIAQNLFGVALMNNPIGRIVSILIVLGVAIVAAYVKFEGFRKVVNTVVNAIIAYIEFMVNMWIKGINLFTSALNKLTGVLGVFGIDIPKIGKIGEVSFGRLATAASGAKSQIDLTGKSVQQLIREADKLAGKGSFTGSGEDDEEDNATGAATAVKTLAETIKSYRDAVLKAVDANKSLADATQGVKDAQTSLTDATYKIEVAQRGVTKATNDVTKAIDNVAKAQTDTANARTDYQKSIDDTTKAQTNLTKATNSTKKAQDALDAAVKGYGADSKQGKQAQRDLTEAQRDAEKAGYDTEKAVFDLAEAEAELITVRADATSTAQMIREAEINLAEAKLALTESQIDQEDSQISVTEATTLYDQVLNGVTEDSVIYKDLLEELNEKKALEAEAIIAVTDARTAEAEALVKIAESLAAEAEAATQVEEAKFALAEAEMAVTKAKEDEAKASRDLAAAQLQEAQSLLAIAEAQKEVNKQKIEAGKMAGGKGALTKVDASLESVRGLVNNALALVGQTKGVRMMAAGGIVTRPTAAIIGERGPEAVIPLNKMNKFGGGTAINITINAGIGTDASAVGDEIVNVLQRYNRRNGALPLKVA
jgi:hypothetical protein